LTNLQSQHQISAKPNSLEIYTIWRILSRYLLNVRKLSIEESYSIVEDWLARCNKLKKLDFSARRKIQEDLKGARKGFV